MSRIVLNYYGQVDEHGFTDPRTGSIKTVTVTNIYAPKIV